MNRGDRARNFSRAQWLRTGPHAQRDRDVQGQQPKMIKSFSALAIMSLLGFAVLALPVFAPQVRASEPAVMMKADRRAVRSIPNDCARQVWPNFEAPCLRDGDTGGRVREARLTTARR
jgi:hypothetical protein